MIRKSLLLLASLISTAAPFAHAANNEVCDTLLCAKSARSILVESNKSQTAVTIRNFDDTGENFFYETGTSSRSSSGERSTINYDKITDILVAETSSSTLFVKFTTSRNDEVSYSFSLPDPENRFVNTYIGAKGSDFGIKIKKAGNTEWDLISGGLGLGWVAPISADPAMNTSMWKSNELTWGIILGVRMRHGRHSLSSGLGIDWRNYVTKGDKYFHKDDEGKITLIPYEPLSRKHRSRIKTFSLQIPLLYGLSFGRGRNCQFLLGPVLNFNTSASIKTQYTIGNNDYSIKTKHIGQRPVTLDVMAEFKYEAVGVYVRYAPMEVLKTETGLSFKSISTGIMVGF